MRTVQAHIAVDASRQRALQAFLDPADLLGWWGVERALVEPRGGGVYALAWGVTPHGFRYVVTGVIRVYDPDHELRIEQYTYFNPERPILGPMRLTVTADARETGGSNVKVIQDGYRDGSDWDWYFEAVRAAWPVALRSLQDYLTRTP